MAPAALGHSAAEAKAYAAEENTALLRLVVILFGVGAYWGAYYPLGLPGIPWLAATISIVALLYALFDVIAKPYARWPIMVTSLWTAVTDGILITLWLHATGDVASPFFPLWYVSIVAVAFRYNWRATIFAGLLYVASYTVLVAATGGLAAHWLDVTLRNGYLLLLAVLAAVLARTTTQVFEERYQLGQQVKEGSRFRALAEATPEPVVVARDGIILEVNRAFCDLTRRARADLIGQSAVEFVDPTSLPIVQRRLVQPTDEPADVWMRDLGQGRRLLRMQSRELDWEGAPARVVSMRDITQERQSEQARQHARDVEMEVARLREMDHFKGEFINAAAHELNTPLTPLKLELHVLRQRMANAPAADQHSLALLDRNLSRLSALVQDMLDVARLQSGRLRLDPKPCDVAKVAIETAETFAYMAQERKVELQCQVEGDLQALADAKRITQVLDNLVSNALKFTPTGGHVRVVARHEEGAGAAAGGMVRIDVTDDGVGLSPEQARALFHPFVQVHRDQVVAPGTGLGLYISRGIAERHGGTLECTSPGPGRGATFTLRLPATGPASAPDQLARAGRMQGHTSGLHADSVHS